MTYDVDMFNDIFNDDDDIPNETCSMKILHFSVQLY